MKRFIVFPLLLLAFSCAHANPDLDGDGVINELDYCEDTPQGVVVDQTGCEPDDDKDGVVNRLDRCPDTPHGIKVDEFGCPLDSDHDGIADYKDKCPGTPTGVPVDEDGCPLDADQDGVLNPYDACPNTPFGYKVDKQGCATKFEMRTGFDYDSFVLNNKGVEDVDTLFRFLQNNRTAHVIIEGHTCNMGGESYNQILSEHRAKAVQKALLERGIAPKRLQVSWKGLSQPLMPNDTEEDRIHNRRVEIKIFYTPEDIAKEKQLP